MCFNSLLWIKLLNVYSWYRELCFRILDFDWKFGFFLVLIFRRIIFKFLRMIYKGYFLYYDDKYGWGYLILDKYKVVFDR